MVTGTGAKVTVAGAGALGLCIALGLARRGHEVVVRDPAALGDNASGVAAGMLAPAFEAALDPVSTNHFDLMLAARDLWPELADRIGLSLDQSGATYRGEHCAVVVERLGVVGAQAEIGAHGVYTPDDWRLQPVAALLALRDAAGATGARFENVLATTPAEGDILILATGMGGAGLAPELARLTPIKGHILRLDGGPDSGPMIRGDGVYICPDSGGAIVGATMEQGLADLAVDAARVEALRAAAIALMPELAGCHAVANTGVRAATADGLPMVGWSVTPGVLLAVGARRNGWLLAPLVAWTIAAYLAGEDLGPYAARLDPRRFDNKDERA